MNDKEPKIEYKKRSEEEYAERLFILILFLTALGLTLLAIFIIAWACDFFGWGPSTIPNGWA